MKRAIALVPARYASLRLPAKPLAKLGGAPLIVRVCENLAATGLFEKILVAVDHEEVRQVVEGAGFTPIMTDPHLPSGTDRVFTAASLINLDASSLILNVQGDEPFVERQLLNSVIDIVAAHPSSIGTPVERITREQDWTNPNVVKAVLGEDQRALYFSRASIPVVRQGGDTGPRYRHVGVYGYTLQTLSRLCSYPEHALERSEKLEQLRWLAHHEVIRCAVVGESARGIDTLADLAAAEKRWSELSLPQ